MESADYRRYAVGWPVVGDFEGSGKQGFVDRHGTGLVWACMMLLADLVANVQCRGCRQKLAKLIKQGMPKLLKEAVAKPVTDLGLPPNCRPDTLERLRVEYNLCRKLPA